nr:reverse transcriptase domain-containing protein [Tanacetum cinerariifolium]
MSAMANTTPIVTTVTKAANKEKASKKADAALKVNILDFCEEHYKDILPRAHSSAETLPARYRNPSERQKMRNRLRHNDENVFERLGHRRQSAFDRLSDTYSPSTTKSGPDRTNSRDRSHNRGRPCRQDSSPNRDRPRSRDRLRGIEESYGNTCSSYRIGSRHRYHPRDRDRSRSMKKVRESKSPLSRVSESGTSDGGHWKSKSKRRKPTGEEDLAVPWSCEEVDPFTPRIRGMLGNAYVVSHVQFYPNRDRESMKYIKDPVEIHNIKQMDGETIEDFIKRFKVETGRMKGAPVCMRISIFMHGVNNPELIKRLNEHVPKTMEEMMTTIIAFIRGEIVVAFKKKVHTSWKPQDQPKRHVSEQRSDYRGHITDECVQLKKQIEELVRASKLSHLIKEIKQGRDLPKLGKKEVPAKDKSMAIFMVQPWHRMTRRKVTQSFARVREITFPPLATSSGTKGSLVIEAKIGGHMIHRMYVNKELCSLLKENWDIFAWQPSNMTGVPRSVVEHRLNIQEGYTPVRQKKRGHAQNMPESSK